MSVRLEDYEVLDIIGNAIPGVCYKVRRKDSADVFLWKAVYYGGLAEQEKELLMSEIKQLLAVKHPNIISYKDYINHKASFTLYIIFDYFETDLSTLIKKCKSTKSFIEENFIWRILYQTARAVHACNSQVASLTMLHHDITPANIYLDDNGHAMLGHGHFTLSRQWKVNDINHDLDEFAGYISPETMRGAPHRKSDTWSLGCLVYDLCTLTTYTGPFVKHPSSDLKPKRYHKIPTHYSEDLQKIINLMLDLQPDHRPTIDVILLHPVIISRIATNSLEQQTLLLENQIAKFSGNSAKPKSDGEKECMKCKQWENKFEQIKQREIAVKSKEANLADKDIMCTKREKQILLTERLVREKLTRAELYLKKCKDLKPPTKNLDSSLSADPGDTSYLQTVSKINPQKILKPNFVKEVGTRSVHFEEPRRSILKVKNTKTEKRARNDRLVWLENKKIKYLNSISEKTERKENEVDGLVSKLSRLDVFGERARPSHIYETIPSLTKTNFPTPVTKSDAGRLETYFRL